MNRDLEILQKMAQEAAEATSNFAKAWEHIKNNRYTYGGAGIGALAGVAGSAFATNDKKKRVRNAILGALGGGAVGAGVGYMGHQNSNLRNIIESDRDNIDRLTQQRDEAMHLLDESRSLFQEILKLRNPNVSLGDVLQNIRGT